MNELQKPKYGVMVKVAVLTIIVSQYLVGCLTSPLLGQINAMYPQYPTLVKQLETIPTLAAIIPCLLIGPLNKYMTKKNMLILGNVLALFQIFPAFISGFPILYACRFLAGLGSGFMYSFAASFIVDMFDGKEQNNMMGMRSAVGAIAGVIILQLSGIWATQTGNYQKSFLLTLIYVPIIVIVIIFMPKTTPVEEAERALMRAPKDEKAEKPKDFTSLTWGLIIMAVINIMFAHAFMTNAAIVVYTDPAQGGLGMTPAVAGNVMSLFSVAMAVSGFIFGPFWQGKFKNYTTAVGVCIATVGLLISYLAGNITVMFIGAIVFGFGFQVYNGGICLLLPITGRPEAATRIIGIFFAFQNAGTFLASLVTPAIANALFPDALKRDWMIAIPGLAVCTVIYFILSKKADKRAKELGYTK